LPRDFGMAGAPGVIMEQELYTVVGPKSWGMMTSHELAGKLADTDVALVPVGAIEQHGGHLPLGQDNYQIEEITVPTRI
jgi:hypothetical protein